MHTAHPQHTAHAPMHTAHRQQVDERRGFQARSELSSSDKLCCLAPLPQAASMHARPSVRSTAQRTSMIVTPWRSALPRALANWCGDWSISVTFSAAQQPAPSPMSLHPPASRGWLGAEPWRTRSTLAVAAAPALAHPSSSLGLPSPPPALRSPGLTLRTMPCVQKPVPPPTSTTCVRRQEGEHPASPHVCAPTQKYAKPRWHSPDPSLSTPSVLTLRSGLSSCAGSRASVRISTVQCPGLTMWSYTWLRKA